jgi:outer membrane protein assembly factor BamA
MMCAWNQPLGSRESGHLAVLLLLCVVTILTFLAIPLAALAQQVELEFEEDFLPTGRQQDWLAEDRSWLGGLPGPERALLHLELAASTADTVDVVSKWVLAQTAGDTLRPVRALDSRLRDRWLGRGFLAVKTYLDVEGASARLVLDPGSRFTIGQLVVEGPDFEDRAHLLGVWLPRPGDDFEAGRLAEGITRLLAGAGEAGYPFARWVTRGVAVNPESATVDIQASLLPGQRSYLGPVSSDLPPGRPSEFLARASGLRSGDLFRNDELERAVQRLLARDLYASVGQPLVYATTSVDTVGIHFPVIPRRKVNRLQVVLGLSRRQDQGPSRLSGEVDLRLPNMAGSGRNLGINWRDDGNQKSHFGLDYMEPMAFGTPLDMELALDSEVETDIYTRFRLDNRWQLPVVALWGVELGVGWDRSTYPVGTLERTSRVRARGAVLHRRGDLSRSGWKGSFAIETGWRSSNYRPEDELSGPSGSQLGEALTQRIYEVDLGGEVWLAHTWSLAGRAAFRQLSGSEDIVPLAEQFRFGGAATLRGYREDEFHGSKASWGGVELRIGPPGGSRLYTFYDLGYFGFSSLGTDSTGSEVTLWKKDWPRGYGLGILARTPGGDISLAIGFPGTVDFELAKLHVTLLETF